MKYPKISFVLILVLIMAFLAGCATTSEIAVDKQTVIPESTALQADAPQSSQVDVKNNMSEQTAKEIALSHAGLSESDVTFIQSTLVNNDGRNEYEFEFSSAGAAYDYCIDAASGEIIAYDKDAEYRAPKPSASTKPGNTPENDIGADAAKKIALEHAGFSKDEVTRLSAKLHYDDGIWEYDVTFYSGNIEYDYDIDAITGEIIAYDKDAEYRAPKPSASTKPGNTPENDIGADAAKKIALEHAGFSKDEVTRLSAKLEYDDGKWEYDVKYYVGRIEYSYEIDAVSGKVLSYEAEQDD